MNQDSTENIRRPITHELKCQEPFFTPIWRGDCTADIRLNDRDFQAGDTVILRHFDPETGQEGPRESKRLITHVKRFSDMPVGVLNAYGLNPMPPSLKKLVVLSLSL